MVTPIFENMDKLAPEERIKKLKEIEARIEQERLEQLKVAQQMIKEAQDRMQVELEKELENDKTIKKKKSEDESLEQTVKKEAVKHKKEEPEEQAKPVYKTSIEDTETKKEIELYRTNPHEAMKKQHGHGPSEAYLNNEKIWEREFYKAK